MPRAVVLPHCLGRIRSLGIFLAFALLACAVFKAHHELNSRRRLILYHSVAPENIPLVETFHHGRGRVLGCRLRDVCIQRGRVIYLPEILKDRKELLRGCGISEGVRFGSERLMRVVRKLDVTLLTLANMRDLRSHFPHTATDVLQLLPTLWIVRGATPVRDWNVKRCSLAVGNAQPTSREISAITMKDSSAAVQNKVECTTSPVNYQILKERVEGLLLVNGLAYFKRVRWTAGLFRVLESSSVIKFTVGDKGKSFRGARNSTLCFKDATITPNGYSFLPAGFFSPGSRARPAFDSKLLLELSKTKRPVIDIDRSVELHIRRLYKSDRLRRGRDTGVRGTSTCRINFVILTRYPSFNRVLLDLPEFIRRLKAHAEEEGVFPDIVATRFERISFADQVRTMRWADVVVGSHGAGLTNIIFMRRGGSLVEVNPFGYPETLDKLARIFDLQHFVVGAKPVTEEFKACARKMAPDEKSYAEKEKGWDAAVREFNLRNLTDSKMLDEHALSSSSFADSYFVRECIRRQNLDFDHQKAAELALKSGISAACRV